MALGTTLFTKKLKRLIRYCRSQPGHHEASKTTKWGSRETGQHQVFLATTMRLTLSGWVRAKPVEADRPTPICHEEGDVLEVKMIEQRFERRRMGLSRRSSFLLLWDDRPKPMWSAAIHRNSCFRACGTRLAKFKRQEGLPCTNGDWLPDALVYEVHVMAQGRRRRTCSQRETSRRRPNQGEPAAYPGSLGTQDLRPALGMCASDTGLDDCSLAFASLPQATSGN